MARSEGRKVDGRRARSERSRLAVVDAILAMLHEGYDRFPTIEDVAARSGLSARTIYRHFEDLESLYVAAVERQFQLTATYYEAPADGGSVSERAQRLAHQRARLFEELAPVRRVVERIRPTSAAVEEGLAAARSLLREQVADLFASELAKLPASRAELLLDALDAATSWYAWGVLRFEAGRSPARARAVIELTVASLLGSEPELSRR